MNKKKLVTMVLAGSLAVGLVGGSLAWFTSSDKVLNKFATVQDDDNIGDSGIDIYECFDEDGAEKILPGGPKVDKYVQVKNTAKYAQLIRVKLIPEWTDETIRMLNGDSMEPEEAIILDLSDNQDWVYNNGYYYYLNKVAPKGFTSNVLDKVSLNHVLGNEYKNAKFNVKVEAEAIQAVVDGDENINPVDEWKEDITDAALIEALKGLTSGNIEDGVDKGQFKVVNQDGEIVKESKETKKQKDKVSGEVQEYSEYKMGEDREEV
ncbi:MAG: hypothetical protein MR274_07935 [Clostridium sp.]|nr:hypothetical protein [Clostridium sp.]MDY3827733.1 hypothetical protein [Clostridium sp.]